MGLFNRMKEPVLLKEGRGTEIQIQKLKEIEHTLTPEGQKILLQDIKNLEAGLRGEKSIIFELMNSHMPVYILHDIYLEQDNLKAQIDFLVVTKKLCFVIECKNLYGDIEITNTSDFIRKIEYNGYKKKEGMYSPITQNQRHIELLKKIKIERNTNIITKFIAQKIMDKLYKGVVVLANPKTVLNAKYAKKEVKQQVIRVDQLTSFIKSEYQKSDIEASNDKQLLDWANSFLILHNDVERDYSSKYDSFKLTENISINSVSVDNLPLPLNTLSGSDEEISQETLILSKLREYRLKKSKEENIKPYYIYNDSQLRDLLNKAPKTKEELLRIAGFGDIKVQKYGDDILRILND